MSVTKYKDVKDMPRRKLVCQNEIAERMGELVDLSFKISPPFLKKGVQKFTRIEEANTSRLSELKNRPQK